MTFRFSRYHVVSQVHLAALAAVMFEQGTASGSAAGVAIGDEGPDRWQPVAFTPRPTWRI
ncbi:hypothetical protein [Roseinatronobacter sp.]